MYSYTVINEVYKWNSNHRQNSLVQEHRITCSGYLGSFGVWHIAKKNHMTK